MHMCAALTGALGLALLAATYHRHGAGADFNIVLMAAVAQMSAAAAGLAIANRPGRLNSAAGGLILFGANLFAGVIYLSAFNDAHPFHALAPVGGAAMIAGWLLLAFARPVQS